MRYDFYPTPPEIADTMVSTSTLEKPKLVADFSAGTGNLLHAALRRWPDTKIIANEYERRLARTIRNEQPDWTVSSCDFLDDRSIKCSKTLRNKLSASVILLNPPFRNTPTSHKKISIGTSSYHSTPTLGFILRSLEHLDHSGELISIVPEGDLSNAKIQPLWRTIEEHFSILLVSDLPRRTFGKVFPSSKIVKFEKKELPTINCYSERMPAAELRSVTSIQRGTLQVHIAKQSASGSRKSLPFVHTTNISSNQIGGQQFRVPASAGRSVCGPAILIPRVGRPCASKICLIESGTTIVISDCIFAITFSATAPARKAFRSIISKYSELSALYKGTGAPHINSQGILLALHLLLGK